MGTTRVHLYGSFHRKETSKEGRKETTRKEGRKETSKEGREETRKQARGVVPHL